MSLIQRLREASLQASTNVQEGKQVVQIQRPYSSLEETMGIAKNESFFSEVLFEATEEYSPLKFCVISLVHYLRELNTLEINDFENNHLFILNDSYHSWCVHHQGQKKVTRHNIDYLVLNFYEHEQNSESKMLIAYFWHKINEGNISVYIPIKFIKELIFK